MSGYSLDCLKTMMLEKPLSVRKIEASIGG